jgi:uncharacterized protein YjiS (DUF1127 family)
MATNLFEAFDSAFAAPPRSPIGELIARLGRVIAGIAERRRRMREMRRLMSMPPHLLNDIGLVAWGGKLWPVGDGAAARRGCR